MPSTDGGSPAPIDRPVLEHVRARLETTRQFVRIRLTDESGHFELRAEIPEQYYPNRTTGELFVRWYTNDDFKIHYRETHPKNSWECRWDRHPNPHNARDHFHPPPDARTPGIDERWPEDYRDVLQSISTEIETRIRTLWTE
ncbi:MAG: hypothetical protein QXG03_09305 [Halalkalicoccus sp.]